MGSQTKQGILDDVAPLLEGMWLLFPWPGSSGEDLSHVSQLLGPAQVHGPAKPWAVSREIYCSILRFPVFPSTLLVREKERQGGGRG